MKCFDEDPMRPHYVSFNYSVIRTRRVVEQAFVRLKGRWRVTAQSKLNDPVFASVVGTVCCGLHNICERYKCPYEDDILPDPQILKMVLKTVTLIFLEVEERSGTSCQNGFMLIILDKLQVWFTFRFLNSYLVIQCSKQS